MTGRTHCKHGHELATVGVRPDGRCAQCDRDEVRRYREANPEKVREKDRRYREANREKRRERDRRYLRALRREVLDAYGPACVLCGADLDVDAYHLDHVSGDGGSHREELGGGTCFYNALKRLGWPQTPPLQTLCPGCHRHKHAAERRGLTPGQYAEQLLSDRPAAGDDPMPVRGTSPSLA